MENTCNVENCSHAKLMMAMAEKLGIECHFPEGCHRYIESWWTQKEGTPKLIKDCADTRIYLMLQTIINGQVGLQAAQEQQRNKSDDAMKFMARIAIESLEAVQESLGQPITTIINKKIEIEENK